MSDIQYMERAFKLALRAKGKTSPNPMVGCVIVKNNRIIAEGYHHRCGADHAEIVALKKAGSRAKGATLYVTLEPCSHYGRTPPCVDKIIASGIKEVVAGMIDPNPVNNGKSILKLRQNKIRVKTGFLEQKLRKANESFIKFIKYKMPFVVVKCAQTLDGKIATFSGQSKWITSPKTRDFTHRLRGDFDAILVGANTALKDNPGLNARSTTKRLKKIVVDSKLQIPLGAKLFSNTGPGDVVIATTRKAPQQKQEILKAKGVSVLVCPQSKEGVNLKWLFRELARREISSLLIEGGSKIVGSALKANLVDKFLMFIAPKIMGDERAVSSVRGFKVANVNQVLRLKNVAVKKIGEDILVEGYI